MKSITKLSVAIGLSLVSTTILAEDKSPHRFNLNFEVGAEADSKIVIDEIDNVNQNGSTSRRYRASARYQYRPDSDYRASLSYSISDKNYTDSDNFDTDLHIVSGYVAKKWDKVTTGIRGQLINSKLGGADFIEMEQISPYVSFFLGKKWFFNFSYRIADKELISNPERSADVTQLTGDMYYFAQGRKQIWQLSLKSKREDSFSDQFDYDQTQIRLSYTYAFQLYGIDHDLRVFWRYTEKDYNALPLVGTDIFRLDQRNTWEARLTTDFSDSFYTELRYRKNNNNSNVQNNIYDQNVASLNLGFRL